MTVTPSLHVVITGGSRFAHARSGSLIMVADMQRSEPDPGTSFLESGAWNESRVARELEAWFAHRAFDRWPTYRTFARDGHKRLHAAVVRTGGAERWAAELGVPVRSRPRGAALSDDEAGDALRQLLRAHRPARFPTAAWLKHHGPPGLAAAVRRTGGGAHWARVLNIPAPHPARWTDELIEAELRRVCAHTGGWPTRAEFEAARATGVRRAVYAGHGSRWWAERLGLETGSLRQRRTPTGTTGRSRSPDTS